jgi:hypothetical protein
VVECDEGRGGMTEEDLKMGVDCENDDWKPIEFVGEVVPDGLRAFFLR